MDRFELTADDGAKLIAFSWRPEGRPRAVIQFAHGAAEHLMRYDRLARALTAQGYAVVGADHRGHGANAGVHGKGDFGPGGFGQVIRDMAAVTAAARSRDPAAPIALLGHSLGSFAAQGYLRDHSAELSALVLSGTARLDLMFEDRAAAQARETGGLRSLNANFEPGRTPFDWLSRDEAEVDAYIADPMCGFDIAPASMATVGAAVMGGGPLKGHALPILVISGEIDPVVGPGQRYARGLVESLEAAGFGPIEHRVYPAGRHEMFNETNRAEVTADLVAWLNARFPPLEAG
jgi:alpha-beta hydrolase superfamily lysophospholipase